MESRRSTLFNFWRMEVLRHSTYLALRGPSFHECWWAWRGWRWILTADWGGTMLLTGARLSGGNVASWAVGKSEGMEGLARITSGIGVTGTCWTDSCIAPSSCCGTSPSWFVLLLAICPCCSNAPSWVKRLLAGTPSSIVLWLDISVGKWGCSAELSRVTLWDKCWNKCGISVGAIGWDNRCCMFHEGGIVTWGRYGMNLARE